MSLILPVSVGNLPEGYCRLSAQQELNTWASLLAVTFPLNYAIFNYGSNAPEPDQQGYPWVRLDGSGNLEGLYVFSNGVWLRPHPVPPESPVRWFYRDSSASLVSYDGGAAGAVTAITGPMWEVDTDMSGRMPIGVSDDFALDATGGAQEVTLTLDELPAHTHSIGASSDTDQVLRTKAATGDPNGGTQGTIQTDSTGDGEPFNIMNPHIAGFWVKRTARQFYTV